MPDVNERERQLAEDAVNTLWKERELSAKAVIAGALALYREELCDEIRAVATQHLLYRKAREREPGPKSAEVQTKIKKTRNACSSSSLPRLKNEVRNDDW